MEIYGDGVVADHAAEPSDASFFASHDPAASAKHAEAESSAAVAQGLRLIDPAFARDPALEVEHLVDAR